MRVDAVLPDLPAGFSPDQGRGATTPAPKPSDASCGLQSAPADLLAFVRAHRVCEAARALGLSERTVTRLAAGYWPAKPRQVLRAWAGYTGRTAAPASRWFLRCVRAGGVVQHGARTYTGHDLHVRVGQLVAVARAAGGGLLAQTLDVPVMRLPLVCTKHKEIEHA